MFIFWPLHSVQCKGPYANNGTYNRLPKAFLDLISESQPLIARVESPTNTGMLLIECNLTVRLIFSFFSVAQRGTKHDTILIQ